MTKEEIQEVVEKGVEEIAINAKSLADAKPRAARFLVRVAVLTNYLEKIEESLPKLQTLVNAQYATAIQEASGKNITEKKIVAEAMPIYAEATEAKGTVDAHHNWVKSYIRIFDNAHVMFRQFSNARD